MVRQKDLARRSGIEVQCDIPQTMERPPRDCELVLFRILQESLSNVHRHSWKLLSATIRLQRNTDHIELEVADSGKGISEELLRRFNASVGAAGVGLTGMRERVRELGGQFEIRSLHTGTTISVALPAFNSSIPPEEAAVSATR